MGTSNLTVGASGHIFTLTNGAGIGNSGILSVGSGTLEINPGSGNTFNCGAKFTAILVLV